MFSLKQIWQFTEEILRSFIDHSLDLTEINDLRIGTSIVLATPGYLNDEDIDVVKHSEFTSTFKQNDFDTSYNLIRQDIETFPDFTSIQTKETKKFTDKLKPIKRYLEKYHILKKLSEKPFGRTYLCINIETFERFIIKEIFILETENVEWKSEIKCLKKASKSGFTPDFVEDIIDGNIVYIVTQYLSNTISLKKYIDLHINGDCLIRTDLTRTESFIRQILTFHEKLIELGIFHGDIYPENILVCLKTFKLYLIDFGLSIETDEINIKNPFTVRSKYYPPFFLSYIFDRTISDYNNSKIFSYNLNVKTQKYAIGCTIVELLSGKDPYSGYFYDFSDSDKFKEPDHGQSLRGLMKYDFNLSINNDHKSQAFNMISLINQHCGTNYNLSEIMDTPKFLDILIESFFFRE